MTLFTVFDFWPSLLILALTLLLIYFYLWDTDFELPPGPVPYQVFGNIPLMRKGKSMDIYHRLRNKYGDVFKLHLGTKLYIVFNGFDVLKEAFVKHGDVFSHRPDLGMLRINKGLISNSGDSWKRTRTFTLNALRGFGFGRKSLQTRVKEEVEGFLDLISQKNSQPFDVSDIVFTSVSNVICSIVFGDRFDHNDERFNRFLKSLHETFKNDSSNGLRLILPFLVYLPGDIFGVKKSLQNRTDVIEFCRNIIQTHRESYDHDVTRDFIDVFLKEERNNPEDAVFSEENMIWTVFHLFTAGTETTATTIRWAILYMIHYPEIQEEIRREIERVVGSSRTPTMEDKPELPYSEAFIIEVLRFANIAPNAIPHGVTKDTMFRGFYIPEKAVLILNLDSVLRDPNLFPNPSKFDPSRFIGKDGKLAGHEKVLAFSLGRRICIGESLARMELFLFITSLVQRFKLMPALPDKLPTLDGVIGLTHLPRPYEFRATEA